MDPKRLWRIAAVSAAAAIFIALVYLVRNALVPVLIAMFLAYLLDPLIDRLERIKLNRTFAILTLAALSVIIIGSVGGFLLVQAQREIVELVHKLPAYIGRLQESAVPMLEQRMGIEIPDSLEAVAAELETRAKALDPSALKPLSSVVSRVTSSTIAFFGWLVSLVIIPVFLYYFLRDFDVIKQRAADYIPPAYRDYVIDKFRQVDQALGNFIRGQLTICLILGVLYSAGLLAIGLDLAVVIGMLSGLAFIVPYFGTVIGVIAATIMALLQFGAAWQLPVVWAVFAVVQVLEGTMITPRVMGKSVGLSPVIVIFALLVGADLMGFAGILVAVPLAAVLKVFIQEGMERYKDSALFQKKPAREQTTEKE